MKFEVKTEAIFFQTTCVLSPCVTILFPGPVVERSLPVSESRIGSACTASVPTKKHRRVQHGRFISRNRINRPFGFRVHVKIRAN